MKQKLQEIVFFAALALLVTSTSASGQCLCLVQDQQTVFIDCKKFVDDAGDTTGMKCRPPIGEGPRSFIADFDVYEQILEGNPGCVRCQAAALSSDESEERAYPNLAIQKLLRERLKSEDEQ